MSGKSRNASSVLTTFIFGEIERTPFHRLRPSPIVLSRSIGAATKPADAAPQDSLMENSRSPNYLILLTSILQGFRYALIVSEEI
jgi:hypothetical protein